MATRKVIIIGSGPAGYTAAIYAARANLAPLMFTGVQSGGQLMLTTLVENFPGFVDGALGPDLMETMRKQAERFGTDMIAEDVTAVESIADATAGKVTGVTLRNLKTGEVTARPVDGLFVAIGHEPNTALFRGQLDLLDNGYVKVTPGTTQTSIAGVFAAGDVADFTWRQAVTAAGTGCVAALEAERYLEATPLG